MLLSVDRYRRITGDETTPSARVEEEAGVAQELLEDALGRPLEQAERTEVCLIEPDGTIYPKVTPVVSVDGLTLREGVVYNVAADSATFSIDQLVTEGDAQIPQKRDVTYTGGFDPTETDVSEPDFTPRYILRDLAWATYALLRPGEHAQFPAGATRVQLGDASVSFDRPRSPTTGGIEWSRETMRWADRRFA